MSAAPAQLRKHLETALGIPVNLVQDADALPAGQGAYLVFARLHLDLHLMGTRLAGNVLGAGWYVYAGSANGPGGIKSRVSRHLRRDKVLRWHIDQLTCAAVEVWAAEFPGRSECELAGVLGKAEWLSFPVKGFGSSDCRTCPAHLLAFSPT